MLKNSKSQIKTVLASLDVGLAEDELDFLGNLLFEDSPDFIDSGDDVFNTLLIFKTQEDAKVDDEICLPLQNQEFEFDDPLRPTIPDDTHPNCRCYWENADTGTNLGQDGAFATATTATSITKVTTVFADTIDGKEGSWKTINGTPVFFPDGADPSEVISKAFKNKPSTPKSKSPSPQAPKGKEPQRFSEARKAHQEFRKGKAGESYSFDPKTGKGFDAMNRDQAIDMYSHYDKSDGKDPVYFISETNHGGNLSRESESAFTNISNQGNDPIIGKWVDDKTGFIYTDVGFSETGLGKKGSDRKIRDLLTETAQESALKLFPDGTVDFVNGF